MNNKPKSLTIYAWLSIATAIVTIILKGVAWQLTGSVGLLSDAIESLVNLAGALMALWMLTVAERPADEDHAFGHSKAEYFSSAFEGFLIIVAAISIGYAAIERLLNPSPLEAVGFGLLVSVVASIANAATAMILLKAGRRHNSITLEADAHHLLTDVWTSVAVISGVGLVWLTGWLWLDPVVALIVAANIVWTGYRLIYRSVNGLMDTSLPDDKLEQIRQLLLSYRSHQIEYHALQTREAGGRAFINLHLLVPDHWSIVLGHEWSERVESDIRKIIPHAHVTTHIEPLSLADHDDDGLVN
ncbi:cation diffusion facilitator family transporter [Laribacter hongkongensis]|uniref:cation diffusion facilitator family transporter n=1 Tax=Laribacter hongkongensis TaxID=168471 RepID=UPI001EFC9752|nr:cation diffusion facilitator family transporter [Laribacter hongkongensis]MCG9083702.1 cation diffusion facilitator family transporter [Laribacter hongkongensis]